MFAGYLEDLCSTPKAMKAVETIESGGISDVTWARSRETPPGSHGAWFWDKEKQAAGRSSISGVTASR